MKRPTIALAMILKNEEAHLPELFKSIEGCFDEIHVTDTGSTDNTVELAKKLGATVHHFEWINDFSAARNYSFSHASTDFVMWLDGDDVLTNKQAFLNWRNDAMAMADYWLCTYDYASDNQGNPLVSFARERVFKTNKKRTWKYFIHEGIEPGPDEKLQYITTWKVTHKRSIDDIKKDHNRNLKIFEKHKKSLNSRMIFYYGKELFEAQRPMEGFRWLMEAVVKEDLAPHDRILGIQYACYSSMACNQWAQAITLAHQGLQLDPTRAEFYTILGDCELKQGRMREALPYFGASKHCIGAMMPGQAYAGAIFQMPQLYGQYPRNQIARIKFQMGDFEGALKEATECFDLYKDEDSKNISVEITKAMNVTKIPTNAKKVDEIVISTPPFGMYEWDEEIAKTKGMGGSETAAIEMAKHLHTLTGLPVKIFNARQYELTSSSGVQYIPVGKTNEYFSKYEPRVHIAWRHNTRLTNAPSYLWAHDLITPTVEVQRNFDKMLCLSPFHKRYTMAMSGVPENEIVLTRNGIQPSRFDRNNSPRCHAKFVFPSSPDRGLDRAIRILDKVRVDYPDVELHVFYGFENLYKSGPQMSALADELKKMIAARPWVKSHGFTQQDEMVKELQTAAIWLHPANFIETFCITAIEMLCSGVYPITRDLGALPDVLKIAKDKNMATIIDLDCHTEEEYEVWIAATKQALKDKAWECVSVDPDVFSWESVAQEWISFMGLPLKKQEFTKTKWKDPDASLEAHV